MDARTQLDAVHYPRAGALPSRRHLEPRRGNVPPHVHRLETVIDPELEPSGDPLRGLGLMQWTDLDLQLRGAEHASPEGAGRRGSSRTSGTGSSGGGRA